jgi:hypothetical protein
MTHVLPQQRLLLELLVMSGEIAIPTSEQETILWRTLEECRNSDWIKLTEINAGFFRVEITAIGRSMIDQPG